MRRVMAAVFVVALAGAACGGDGGGGSVEAFCELLRQFQAQEGEFQNAFEDPAQLAAAVDAVDEIADAAPSEIRDDARTVADGFSELADAFSDIDPADPDAALEAFENVEDQVAELEVASASVEQYADENCDLDLNEDGS